MNRRSRLARALVTSLLKHLRGGTLELVDMVGHSRFGEHDRCSTNAPVAVRIDVNDPRVYERILREGSVGLGESYADGWWDADDLTSVLRLALRSLETTSARRDAQLFERGQLILRTSARLREKHGD